MGGRGAFLNINTGDFTFKTGGQIYHTVGEVDGVKFLVQEDGKSGRKVPDYSHSADTKYALIAKGEVKSIAVYKGHQLVKSYDLQHAHYEPTLGKKLGWHYHTDIYHKTPAHELSETDILFVNKVLKEAKKYL